MNKDRLFELLMITIVVILSLIGIILVYSAGSYYSSVIKNDPFFYVQKQVIFVFLGLISAIGVLKIVKIKHFFDYKLLQVSSIIMISVLIALFFIGTRVNGAKGWINLGFLSIQPLEFAKLLIIWAVAFYFYESRYMDPLESSENSSKLMKIWEKNHPEVTLIGICSLIIIAVLMQPDTGGALILIAIILALLGASGLVLYRKFLKYGAMLTVSGISLITLLSFFGTSDYRIRRILVFLNPFDPSLASASFQIRNSFYALSRGGLTGVGIGNSIQKTGYLPEFHTDFILAIIGEELGILGVLAIVMLLLLLVFLIFRRSLTMTNVFYKLVTIGIGSMFLVQSFLNIAGIISLAPLTGVTLPFISYGGSSIIASYISIAIIIKISIIDKQQKKIVKKEDK